MKDNAVFQVELDNPTDQRYLANISVNGTSIGPGIVLRPGEHIFLDRYTESNNMFKFSTYEVSHKRKHLGSSNGVVEISFHAQNSNTWTTWTAPLEYSDNTYGTGITYTYSTDSTFDTSNIISSTNINYSSSKLETGTVEKGPKSKQKLEEGSGNFSFWSSKTLTYKILPESQKDEVYIGDIRSYCTECGRRAKKGWKFCPSCGSKV